MKDKLGGKIMKESAALRGKTYHYLRDNSVEDKLTKSTKKCIIKQKVKFEDYRYCLQGTKLETTRKKIKLK